MKDVILLALSVLRKEKQESVLEVEGTDVHEKKYIGQMEPVVLYKILSETDNDIEVIALCTDRTLNDSNNYAEMSALAFFESRIKELVTEHGFSKKITITPISISEGNPIDGISATASHIRNITDMGAFWIDTHGGFRDVSLILEAVISLLKVDNIYPDHIFGIRYDEQRAFLTDQSYAFDMFEFFSGMNDFINIGSI